MHKKNIFVIGDLVIDHTIFVKADQDGLSHQAVGGEAVYEVFRRRDDAGGAANTARILSVMNQGKTFLWGIIGESHWGDFRSILANSDRLNEANQPIELRGVKDETGAQMNTITRIIKIDPTNETLIREHKVRFDDYGHFHVTDVQRKSALYYLKRAQMKYRIDAIIINDLDMGSLRKDMIEDIANYANDHRPSIPLFIDPKRDKDKYENIVATAILPNLHEWCHIVGEEKNQDRWRQRLNSKIDLAEMAVISLSKIRKIKYHVITCDKDGAVFIAPYPDKPNFYAVYRIHSMPTEKPSLSHNLGCGDIMTGIFALEFSESRKPTESVLHSLLKANASVRCYREMPWHQMPVKQSIEECIKLYDTKTDTKIITEVSIGRLCLPSKEDPILLSKYVTDIPNLYSQDTLFRDSISELIDDICSEWKPTGLRSIILAAGSGSGKSTIANWVCHELKKKEPIHTIDLKRNLYETLKDKNFETYFNEVLEIIPTGQTKLLIIVDEAFKAKEKNYLIEQGVNLLNSAHEKNIRFLFIDADFEKDRTRKILDSQFFSRCNYHRLSCLEKRPMDIPIIIAAHIFLSVRKKHHKLNCVKIDGQLLLAIITDVLSKSANPRSLCALVDRISKESLKRPIKNTTLDLKIEDRPKNIKIDVNDESDIQKEYEFLDLS